MAQTRGATGNSKPRVFDTVSTEPTRKRKSPATKKATTTGTKKSTTGAGVTKKRAPNAHHKRKPSVKDKVEGAVEKVEGMVTDKPTKKSAGTKKMKGADAKNSKTAVKA